MYDEEEKTMKSFNQPYYVQPSFAVEGRFLYVAGLYEEKHRHNKRQFSFAAVTQSAGADERFIGYVPRIPLFLRHPQQVKQWLNVKHWCAREFTKNPYKANLMIPFPQSFLTVVNQHSGSFQDETAHHKCYLN